MTFARKFTEWKESRAAQSEANRQALCTPSRALHRGSYTGTTSGEAIDKEDASQHAGYMNAVRGLGYCMRCRRACRPQFCHRDEGKGMGIKTDVRHGWPGCAECHFIVGTSGQYQRDEKRALETALGWRTRQAVIAAGTWPKTLAKLIGEEA